ncbi:MAG: 50S ribosomal protein L29 [Gammaproteobacteria bacterium]|jgi:large subunit ribosomal protein L29|nr:50S ribosomal protein L29 [Pseudomonadota bacterium]NCX10369.1 50S ribosomal protein L29 [Pseudomonadota bacterium]NCX24461.1 50S ribosomal protein L29 [Pseudomonadota bacterium]NCX29945.1 50S ribosomal protein L29 [Pseudomonadota bacterium]|tara:strand:- start:243 stop:449 length:207 start_codon:yes stop_codon:yes gene_type:complete
MNKELQDLRKKNLEQLDAELLATREEQFNLRIKHKTGQLNETNQLGSARKKIARIKTLMNELKTQDSK